MSRSIIVLLTIFALSVAHAADYDVLFVVWAG